MGNCICPSTTETHVDLTPLKASSTSGPANSTRCGEVKEQRRSRKLVKIEQGEEGGEGKESKAGGKGLRIRVVLTQQELKDILDEFHNGESKCSNASMEVLLRSALKRRRRLKDCNKGGWRPALQSIPEDA